MVRDIRRVERDQRSRQTKDRVLETTRSAGAQHVASTGFPASSGSDGDIAWPAPANTLSLYLCPLIDLHAQLKARYLAIQALSGQLAGVQVPVYLSLWVSSSAIRDQGVWSARLIRRAQRRLVPLDDDLPNPIVADLGDQVLLDPDKLSGVYLIGLQADFTNGGTLTTRCPQGAFSVSQGQFFAGRRAAVNPSSPGDYPETVTAADESQHFFGAALSPIGYHYFLRRL